MPRAPGSREGTHLALPASRVKPGWAKARPAAGPSWAPGSPALLLPVPKLLNLRAALSLAFALAFGGSAPPGASVLGDGSQGPSMSAGPGATAPLRLAAPGSCLRRASARPPGAPSPERGQSALARGRESPLRGPTPSRPPFLGSTRKNGLERRARESAAPSRTPLPGAVVLRLEREAGTGTSSLDPGAGPWGISSSQRTCTTLHLEVGTGPRTLAKCVSLIGNAESYSPSGSNFQSIFPVQKK